MSTPDQTPSDDVPSNRGRGTGCLLLVLLVIVAVVAVPLISRANGTGPQDWIDGHYASVSGDDPHDETVRWSSGDDLDTVVAAIVSGTDPDETTVDSASTAATKDTYLRYGSDWVVKVSEDDTGTGSSIEMDEFDRGYNRHGGIIALWGSHYGRGGGFFRGGGFGSGK